MNMDDFQETSLNYRWRDIWPVGAWKLWQWRNNSINNSNYVRHLEPANLGFVVYGRAHMAYGGN